MMCVSFHHRIDQDLRFPNRILIADIVHVALGGRDAVAGPVEPISFKLLDTLPIAGPTLLAAKLTITSPK